MISVIMATYNGTPFIDQSIGSILNQSIDREQWELIIVDDGSIDNTVEVLREYEKNYPNNIKVIDLKKNHIITKMSGHYVGIKEARGDYIMTCDQDDWYEPDALKILHDLMDSNSQLDYIEYKFNRVDKNDKKISISYDKLSGFKIIDLDTEDKIVENIHAHALPGYTYVWCKIYKRSFLESNDINFIIGENITEFGDNYFTGLVSLYAKHIGKYYEPLYNYRIWNGAYTGEIKINSESYKERLKTGIVFFEECKKRGLLKVNRNMVEFLFLRMYYEKTIDGFVNKYNPIPYDILYEMRETIINYCSGYKSNPYITVYGSLNTIVPYIEMQWDDIFVKEIRKVL